MNAPTPNKVQKEKKAAEDAASVERCRAMIAEALNKEGCKLRALRFEQAPGGWFKSTDAVVIEKK